MCQSPDSCPGPSGPGRTSAEEQKQEPRAELLRAAFLAKPNLCGCRPRWGAIG